MSFIKQHVKSINPVQLLFELLIVFMGVYMAFVFSSFQENRKLAREEERVVNLLLVNLERYEQLFEGFVLRHNNTNAAFKAQLEKNVIPDFSQGAYYPSPQYPIDVINFILTKESYKIFTIETYAELAAFANALQRLTYVEEKLVVLGERYEPLPSPDRPDYERMASNQKLNAIRYLNYMETRKNVSQELVKRARELQQVFKRVKSGASS